MLWLFISNYRVQTKYSSNDQARRFLSLPLVSFLCLGSMITYLLLGGDLASAEWLLIDNGKPGMTIHVNPDTIRRNGNFAMMWELYDFTTEQKVSAHPHFSFKTKSVYDCKQARTRWLKSVFFSGHMGRGKVVYSRPQREQWQPVQLESVFDDLWSFACGTRRLYAQHCEDLAKEG